MQPRKEHYRQKLPHFQQPGQWYSVTCTLHGAMPKGAMKKYSIRLETAKNRLHQLEFLGVGLSKSNNFDLGKSKSRGFGALGVGVSNSNIFDLESQSPENSKSELAQAKKDYQLLCENTGWLTIKF